MKKEHKIAADDGVKSFVLEISPTGAEKGPPIICIHGLTRNHKDFEPIFEFLTGLGRRVFAIDVRGRGNSDYDANALNYNPLRYAQDVLGIMSELQIEKAVFIGTSMGGLISMVVAMFAPQKIAGLILNDVGPELNPNGIARIRDYVGLNMEFEDFDKALDAVKSINGRAYPLRKNDETFWFDFAKRVLRPTSNGFEWAYDANIRQVLTAGNPEDPPPNLWPQFSAIPDIPMGIIIGELSDVITPELVDKMKIARPNLKTALVPNIGHAPILDEEPAIGLISEILATAN